MTKFLHWRKPTWALMLWSGYIATWTLITGPGPAMVALWWLAGMTVLGSLLFATQPLFTRDLASAACSSGPGGRVGASTSTESTGRRSAGAMGVESHERSRT